MALKKNETTMLKFILKTTADFVGNSLPTTYFTIFTRLLSPNMWWHGMENGARPTLGWAASELKATPLSPTSTIN